MAFGSGLFFGGLALLLVAPLLNHLPEGIHAWAQADRLALAFGFYDHQLDFFRPRTYSLASIDGVTGVEFPLQAWLAALAGKLVGRAAIPAAFRLLTVTAAAAAATALARYTYAHTGHVLAALVPGTFYLMAPVVTYYAANFLPDTFGASLALMGIVGVLRFFEAPAATRHFGRHLLTGLALLTLATLVKTSTAAWLAGALGLTAGWSYLAPAAEGLTLRQKLLFLTLAGSALVTVGGYVVFNRWLNIAFQSDLYLADVRPPESAEEWAWIRERYRTTWRAEYFTENQYRLLKAMLVLLLPYALTTWRRYRALAGLLAVGASGVGAFLLLFGAQLVHHDYYVIAPLMPAAALLTLLTVLHLARTAGIYLPRWATELAWAGVLAALLVPGLRHYRARIHDPYPPFSDYYSYRAYVGGQALLTKLGVPPKARLLVLNQDSPNTALVYLDHQGLTWQPNLQTVPTAELAAKMRDYGLGYAVLDRPAWQVLQAAHPDLGTFLTPLSTPADASLMVLQRLNPEWHW